MTWYTWVSLYAVGACFSAICISYLFARYAKEKQDNDGLECALGLLWPIAIVLVIVGGILLVCVEIGRKLAKRSKPR